MKPWPHANPFCDGNLESSRRILPIRALPAQCLDFPLEEPRRESDLKVHRKEPDENRTNYEIYPATANRVEGELSPKQSPDGPQGSPSRPNQRVLEQTRLAMSR